MSTLVSKNVQVGTSGTATDNFTIFQPATPDGTLRIGNGNTGITTSLVTLNSSGNVGIGTSTPAYKLHVNSGTGVLAGFVGNDANNYIQVSDNNGAGFVSFGAIAGGNSYTFSGGYHAIYTGGSERARLDFSGNFMVGTTSTAGTNTNSLLYLISNGSFNIQHNTSQPSGTIYASFNYNGGGIGSVTQNGTTGVLYNTSSDYRLKNITGPITTSGAYIDSLNPVEGTWKADGSTFVGLIAHEVQEASRTNVATGTKDGEEMQGMDYSSAEIIANLIAEVKSLRQRLAAAGI